jgi:outer membrane receptor for ferrienterochelin and colicins
MLMQKKILLFICCCFFSAGITAQSFEIKMVSAKTGEAVADAHILISTENADAKPFRSVTNNDGIVSVPLAGKIFITISHTSFQPYKDTTELNGNIVIQLQPSLVPLDEIVVTANFSPTESKRSLYNTTVIKEESVQRRGANNLTDVLKQQLNVRVKQDAVLGTGIALQGLGGQQVKILIDGVPVVGRINGNIDISQLNMNDAARIEIIEGPVSMQYGTNALGGVVNIITKSAAEKFSASVNTYYESVGQYNIDGSMGFNRNKHSLRVSGGRYFFDGYSNPDTSRVKQWDPKEQYFASLRYGFKLKELQLTYAGSFFREMIENRGELRPLLYVNAFDDYYKTLRIDNSISAKGKIFNNHYLDQVVAYNYYQRKKNTYVKDLTSLEKTLTTNAEDQDTARFANLLVRGVVVRDKKSSWLNYQLGYDINYETGKGARIEGGKQSIGDYAMFFNFIFQPVEMLSIQPGARWSYNTAYRAPISPVLNVKLQPIPQINIRTSYARGFRAPDLKELYFEFVDINHNIIGNPNLEAETSHNFNFNIQYAETFRGKHFFKVQPSYFFNDIKNNIFLVITDFLTNTATNINIGHYQTMGTQTTVQYTFNRQLNIAAGFSYTGRRFDYDTVSSSYYFSPEVSAEISYNISKIDVNVSLFNKWNGELVTLALQENDLVEQTLAAYTTMDISASRSFWKKKIHITVGGKNMLNVTNIAARGYAAGFHGGSSNSAVAGWGRTAFVSLRFNFAKNS